jgi:hypothetical protein
VERRFDETGESAWADSPGRDSSGKSELICRLVTNPSR